jgi:predicted transposase YdaD
LDEWIYYLKNTEIPDHFTAQGLKEAREQLRYDNLSEKEKRAYDHHVNQTRYEQNVVEDSYFSGRFDGKTEGRAEGLVEGEAIGLEKGETIGLEKVVINSNRAGHSIEAISTITGLTQEEIIHILEREVK